VTVSDLAFTTCMFESGDAVSVSQTHILVHATSQRRKMLNKFPTNWVSAQPQPQNDSLDWLYKKTSDAINTLNGKTEASLC